MNPRDIRYAEEGLRRELDALRATGEGARAEQAYRSAAAVGQLVGAGAIPYERAEALLVDAAIASGLDEREALGHVRNGLRDGSDEPRVLPSGLVQAGPTRTPKPPTYPPREEVDSLWHACVPVTEDEACAAWLASDERKLDPYAVDARDLARALPVDAPRPAWAKSWKRYGLLVPTFDEHGAMRSFRARAVESGNGPKELAPGGWSATGLVLADALARQILETARVPEWWDGRLRVLIAEGSPDYLTWATHWGDAAEYAPAVLSIPGSGAWTQAIADRIPDDSEVLLWTHHDTTGNRYAEHIGKTLGSRVKLLRARPRGAPER